MRQLEVQYVESERDRMGGLADLAPASSGAAFVEWFEALEEQGPGQGDPLFPWLASEATLPQMKWFLRQELAGEAGFDDLVALAQLRLPAQAKLELARNYWDELGRGSEGGMHGPMLEHLAKGLALDMSVPVAAESHALANLMLALAMNRRYAYQLLGALGVVELTAPGRSAMVNEGLKRLGVAPDVRRYFALHATLDIKHSRAWNREVFAPLVDAHPEAAVAFAEGALLRLAAGHRCFERYRRTFGLSEDARFARAEAAE